MADRPLTHDVKTSPPRGAAAMEDLVRKLEDSSIEDVLRIQDQLSELMRTRYERKLAVLFCDIAGSTGYFEQHGDSAGRRMIQRFSDLLVPAVERFSGRVVKRIGDALMVTFPSAQLGVDGAIAMQQAVHGNNVRSTLPQDRLEIRIGINFGVALVNEHDGDAYGDMVNVAARVQSQAGPGQIFIADAVKEGLSPSVPVKPAGAFTPRGKSLQFTLHEVCWSATDTVIHLERTAVDGRYLLLNLLGQGGMAAVWRARDQHLGREVAIKVLHPHLPLPIGGQDRFRREAQVAANLVHENIVQTYDYSAIEAKTAYIALELVEGESLRARMDRGGRMPAVMAALIGHEVARALGHAHAKGVIHRDVKPDNVLVSSTGAVKLGDFGIAIVGQLMRLTAQGAYSMGTPGYVAPEQLRGQPVDARADLFALGVMLYELCVGRSPFQADTAEAMIYLVLENNYAPPEQQGVDPSLAAIIRACLQVDPAARPQSGTAVAEQLAAYARGCGVADPRDTLARYFMEGVLPAPSHSAPLPTDPLPQLPPEQRVSAAEASAARPHPRRRWAEWMVGGASLALVGAVGVILQRSAQSTVQQMTAPVAVAPAPNPVPVLEAPVAEPAQPQAPAQTPRTRRPPARAQPKAARNTPVGGTGLLKISLQRGWAEIHVDGVYRGTAPQLTTLELPAGGHQIRLLNKYRRPFEQTVVIVPGATRELRVDLQPLP